MMKNELVVRRNRTRAIPKTKSSITSKNRRLLKKQYQDLISKISGSLLLAKKLDITEA